MILWELFSAIGQGPKVLEMDPKGFFRECSHRDTVKDEITQIHYKPLKIIIKVNMFTKVRESFS